MTLFYTFFFVFSLRLGGIIIGVLTLVKSSIWLMLEIWGLESVNDFSAFLEDIVDNDPLFNVVVERINLYNYLEYYIIGLATFYAVNIIICIFLLIGAYYCKPNFIYPFLVFYVLYTILLCVVDMSLMYLIITKDNDGLEIVIMYFSVVFFILVYCIYTWCCVYSLVKVINILQKQLVNKIKFRIVKEAGTIPQHKKIEFSNN